MTFTEDLQALHNTLRTAIALVPGEQIDPVLKEVAVEAYALGMKRGIERTHRHVKRVVYTITGMLAGVVALAVIAGWTV
jgi:hypothetical protein